MGIFNNDDLGNVPCHKNMKNVNKKEKKSCCNRSFLKDQKFGSVKKWEPFINDDQVMFSFYAVKVLIFITP